MHGSLPNITYHLIGDIKQVWKTDIKNVKWATRELVTGRILQIFGARKGYCHLRMGQNHRNLHGSRALTEL